MSSPNGSITRPFTAADAHTFVENIPKRLADYKKPLEKTYYREKIYYIKTFFNQDNLHLYNHLYFSILEEANKRKDHIKKTLEYNQSWSNYFTSVIYSSNSCLDETQDLEEMISTCKKIDHETLPNVKIFGKIIWHQTNDSVD